MESVFGWIGQFIQYISCWIPRPYLINVTQRAVRFRTGQEPRIVEPGLRLQVPLFSTVEIYSLLKEATEFNPAVLPTRDGKTVAVGFVIVWHIDSGNVIRAATTTDDLEEMIGEIGESLLPPLILGFALDELMSRLRGARGMKTINDSLTGEANILLEAYGVTVDSARVNFVAPTRVYRVLTE